VKVVTLFFFITIIQVLLYVIIFTHANYNNMLEIKHVSRMWNTFCSYSVLTEYCTPISNVISSNKFVVLG
jgi:hypothetical protein